MSRGWNFSCILKWQHENSFSPARHNFYPPTHTSRVQSLQLRTSCVLFSCNKKGIFAVLTAQTLIHTHWDHLTHPCLPCADFPKQAERTKGESHVWQGQSDMNGESSKWNQQSPKTSLWFQEKNLQAAVCRCMPGSATAVSVGGQIATHF